jgi:hypothetical protein
METAEIIGKMTGNTGTQRNKDLLVMFKEDNNPLQFLKHIISTINSMDTDSANESQLRDGRVEMTLSTEYKIPYIEALRAFGVSGTIQDVDNDEVWTFIANTEGDNASLGQLEGIEESVLNESKLPEVVVLRTQKDAILAEVATIANQTRFAMVSQSLQRYWTLIENNSQVDSIG